MLPWRWRRELASTTTRHAMIRSKKRSSSPARSRICASTAGDGVMPRKVIWSGSCMLADLPMSFAQRRRFRRAADLALVLVLVLGLALALDCGRGFALAGAAVFTVLAAWARCAGRRLGSAAAP